MADGVNHGKTQIIIALIGTIGIVAAALIANWDKFFDQNGAQNGAVASQLHPRPAENAEPCDSNTDRAPLWGRLNDFTYDLADAATTNRVSDESKKRIRLQELARIATLMSKTQEISFLPAANPEEANAQADYIIARIPTFCSIGELADIFAKIEATTGRKIP